MSGGSAELTPALVRWAYRFLLGRDPESEAVVEGWCGAGSLSELRDGILTSPEMAAVVLSGFAEQGGWIENRATAEAASSCLLLCTDQPPDAERIAALLLRRPSLRGLRRFLLDSPFIEARLPRPEGPRSRTICLAGTEFTLKGDSREADFLAAPGPAPRLAALLRAIWPDGGEGRVLAEAGAGIGLSTLGLAAGAPRHARMFAHEGSLRRAAALSENVTDNGLGRVAVRAMPMGAAAAMMARENAARLDLLRLNEPDAARQAPAMADWLERHGTLTLIRFDLAEILAAPGPGPREALLACQAAFPHLVGFDAMDEPQPIQDDVALNAALHRMLRRPDRADEFLLCQDLDWLSRYQAP